MAHSYKTQPRIPMRIRHIAVASALALAASACSDVLSTEPYDRLPAAGAIRDLPTAMAALNGAYASLQSGSVYGLDVPMLGDLAGDNGVWVGTYQFLGDFADNTITADNPEIEAMWAGLYRVVDRSNMVIRDIPPLENVGDDAKDEIVGSAHFLRAVAYHNLVKFWGPVPTPTVPVTNPDEAAAYTRTPVTAVYDLILSDLAQAEALIPADADDTRRATRDAAVALRARVLFYRASIAGATSSAADYQGALDAAEAVIAGRDLDVPYADLFTEDGDDTDADIFRVPFTEVESNSLGSYWLSAGRFEAAPSEDLANAYEPGDLRRDASIAGSDADDLEGVKYPTTAGASDPHVIRLGELVLIKAEVLARQSNLPGAVAAYNQVRERAGLAPHVLGVDVTTQADVLVAILHERRIELALEGDRFPDLVRLGMAVTVLDIADRPWQASFPIPLADINTSPGLVQTTGY